MDKKELRLFIKQKINELDDGYFEEASQIISDKVISLDTYRNADTIFSFVSAKGEPDTKAIIENAFSAGKKVCVPLCIGDGIMIAKEIRGFDELQEGYYGLLEPSKTATTVEPTSIDFAIIPCVSCDHQGNRLGHGKGFYDRYLSEGNFDTCMICFEKLTSSEIPTDVHDKKIKLVITEEQEEKC